MTTQDAPETTKSPENYTVSYEIWNDDTHSWEDDTYADFPSEQAAEEAFVKAWGDEPHLVRNPRVVKMTRKIPGNWGVSARKR
jgi:hypothetical protein